MQLIKKNLLYDKSNKNPVAPINKKTPLMTAKPPKPPSDLIKEVAAPPGRDSSIRQSRDSEKLFPAVPNQPQPLRQASVDKPRGMPTMKST